MITLQTVRRADHRRPHPPTRPLAATWRAALAMALGGIVFAACSSDESTPLPETPPAPEPEPEPVVEPICVEGGHRWSPGEVAFSEVTGSWGLEGVMGTRINVVDFDGDGWADLLVRRGASRVDDFNDPPPCCSDSSCGDGVTCPARHTWLLRNTGQGSFEDVTESSGLVTPRQPTEARLGRPGTVYAFADIDNDGDVDAYSGLPPDPNLETPETSELLLNDGTGRFTLGPEDSPVRQVGFDAPGGAVFVDYDRNGLVDLFLPQNDGGPTQDRLLWGDGTGAFVDVTDGVGMSTAGWSQFSLEDMNAGRGHTFAWGGVACDLNGDGFSELLASSYGRSPNHLWQSRGPIGEVAFDNRSVESGYAFDPRTDWSDNESARCWCMHNPGDEGCAGVPEPELIVCNGPSDAFRWNHATDREPYRLGGNSGATVCADVDNDGAMDLLTTEIVHWDVGSSSDPSELLFNTGAADVTFERPGNETTGLTRTYDRVDWNDGDITAAVFDFDNDGWPDVYIGSTDYPGAKGLLYHQVSPRSFEGVPFAEGVDHNRSHGVAAADFDRDGDLDVIVGHSRSRCGGADDCYPTMQVRLFENVAPASNWVQLSLEGAGGSNRSAIGARVTVVTEDGAIQTQEVDGGHGHYGAQRDPVLHFGLGAACVAQVTVRWPDAALTEQTFEVVSGHRFRLVQGGELELADAEGD